ncbi:MAG: aminotransferase class I/II-fold pyridoxal phosphate-dependent enzyme, partial [Vicinamibacteria bacterium]
LQAMAEQTGVHVLVDEVYLDVTNLIHGSLAASEASATARAVGRYTPAALVGDRLLSISSLTKSYGLGGLRCGWIIAAPDLAERARRVRDVIDNIGAAPADRLSVLAFSQLDQLAQRAQMHVSKNLAIALSFFAHHPNLELAAPMEATIVFPRMSEVADTDAFVDRLFAEHGVAVVPGRFFGARNHIRISLAGRTDVLAEGLDRLTRALSA